MSNVFINELNFAAENVLTNSEFLYTTHFWVEYLEQETHGKAILLEIKLERHLVYFVGIIFKKYGLRICGSPFEGWSTPYMGFIGIDKLSIDEKAIVLRETIKYLKRKKKCIYVQICDWNIDFSVVKRAKLRFENHTTLFLDITKSEEELFSSFKVDVRTNCRNFLKRGAYLKEVSPDQSFASDYYNQLVEVFEKQGLQSFYSLEKIKRILNLFEKDREDLIFCENVYEPKDNLSIATGIFFGYKKRCYFFGAASLRDYQILRPNEYVIWNAIKHWKNKGCTSFDMLGVRKYKEKFAPALIKVPVVFSSKLPFLHFFKGLAKKAILLKRKK